MAKKDFESALGQDPFEDLADEFKKDIISKDRLPEAKPETVLPDTEIASSDETQMDSTTDTDAVDMPEPQAEIPTMTEEMDAHIVERDAGTGSDSESTHSLEELIAVIDQEDREKFGIESLAELGIDTRSRIGEEQHIIFALADTEYAVSISNLIQTDLPPQITTLPNVPDWILGITSLRGDIISMVDLGAFLGIEAPTNIKARRMLVAQTRQEDMMVGLIVDQVRGMRYLQIDQIREPKVPIEGRITQFIRGVYEHGERLLVVLDFDKLLLSPEMRQFDPI
ncbi:MAG: chemotaxis protein CheW [Chloroflexota bacterium]